MWPSLLAKGGIVVWVLLVMSATVLVVFIERILHYHRAQINSAEFISGMRNVLKRDNVVEALSICDATPGPVPRLVKTAILNREKGKQAVREALEEAGLVEVPRLEEKLNYLATSAQIAPLIGFLGTVVGFMKMFWQIQSSGLYANLSLLSTGIWEALISTAGGLSVAIASYVFYNYLVSRVNSIVLDMEKTSTEIINLVAP